jgi:dTDP-glucose 4,6-dehydratase
VAPRRDSGGVTSSIRRVVVTGGAGFLGSHLCEALIARGVRVVCVDDLSTGSAGNLVEIDGHDDFELVVADVSEGLHMIEGPIDAVLHLASAASPPDYLARPLETLAVGSEGTRHALKLATMHDARFILASTSEVYGDPVVHPQPESYWGNVNPIGQRSVYDEAKRFAEALTMAWHRTRGTDVGIARIFNTYGPRLRPTDGRIVSNFLIQAIEGQPLTVYGNGTQTRSLCFVDDMVHGLMELLSSGFIGVMNIGNPDERTVLELAHIVLQLTGSRSTIVHTQLPEDDPGRRCPDITMARKHLGWEPTISLEEGLRRTADFFRAMGIGPAYTSEFV